MTALPLATFLQLAAACAPGVAPETLAAIARTESAFETLAIGVNGPGGGAIKPTSEAEAVQRAQALIAQGRSIDLGLMQINNKNLNWLGLTVAEAFDPCRSIAAGAAVLTAYSRYNTGSPTRGFANGYVARVQSAAARTPVQTSTTPTPPAPAAPPSDSWDVWAAPPPPPPPAGADEAAPDSDTAPRLIVELAP